MVELDGERQEKAPIKVNGKGQINKVIIDLEAREEIKKSEGRKGPWDGRKRKAIKKRKVSIRMQCGFLNLQQHILCMHVSISWNEFKSYMYLSI